MLYKIGIDDVKKRKIRAEISSFIRNKSNISDLHLESNQKYKH